MIDTLTEEARAVAGKFVDAFAALVEIEKGDPRSAFLIAETFAQHLKSKWPMAAKEMP